MSKNQVKSVSQSIIDALLTGESLTIREITEMIYETTRKRVASQDVASMMARLHDSRKCDLGFFITRVRKDKHYVYRVVPELLEIPIDKIYGLARRTGRDRCSLSQIVVEFPELHKYVDASALQRDKDGRKATAEKKPTPKVTQKAAGAPAKTPAKKVSAPIPPPDISPVQIESHAAKTEPSETESAIVTATTAGTAPKEALPSGQTVVLSLPEDLRINLNLNVTINFEGFGLNSKTA